MAVACGGLESTRLLLASPGPAGKAIGNHSDHLGRWYMTHLDGRIAKQGQSQMLFQRAQARVRPCERGAVRRVRERQLPLPNESRARI